MTISLPDQGSGSPGISLTTVFFSGMCIIKCRVHITSPITFLSFLNKTDTRVVHVLAATLLSPQTSVRTSFLFQAFHLYLFFLISFQQRQSLLPLHYFFCHNSLPHNVRGRWGLPKWAYLAPWKVKLPDLHFSSLFRIIPLNYVQI